MDLGDVKIATGLDVHLLQGIVAFLYEQGVIPDRFTDPDRTVEVALDPPVISVDDPHGVPALVLGITGSFRPISASASARFDARLGLEPFVRTVPGAAPVAALRAGGFSNIEPAGMAPVLDGAITAVLDDVLLAMDLPLFEGLISRVESVFFPLAAPDRDEWAADFFVGCAGSLERVGAGFPPGRPDLPRVESTATLPTAPALVATLALPGEDPALPGRSSIVPEATGAQILVAEATMNAMLAAEAAAMVGTSVAGATITSLSMEMTELGIEISGRSEDGPAPADWNGTLLVFFSKGQTVKSTGVTRWHDGFVNVFASGIDVEADIAWWVTLLRAVGAVVLGPVYWVLDATLVPPELDEADEPPDLGRSAFRDNVTSALGATIANAANLDDDTATPLMIFGHDAWVLDGHYATSLLAFAGSTVTTIDGVDRDRSPADLASGSSVGVVEIGTGHALHPNELGPLVEAGIVRVPGYRGIEARNGQCV